MIDYSGKQIDRYRIIERLGMGGMAVVYKAYDTRLERDVALKLIRVDEIPPSQHERLIKRFEREAKAMARFSHPNIVPVYDYGEVDGTPYLVMEHIPGGTLKDRINKPIPYQQAIRWLAPIADALRYAHERNVLHRDIKPSNILFDSEDRPMLTDFGIAKVLETDEATLTGTGLGVGTPEYMAPEQWQGKTSEATDQYALGVVFYELITGRKPYSADTPAAIILMQATEPLAPPSGLVQGIPASVEKVLYKALARDPQDRYENMDAFSKALSGLLAEAETAEPVLPEQTTQPVEPSPEVAATANSEAVTRDALDATPTEGIPQQTVSSEKKKGLHKWVGWALSGIVGLILITLAFNLGSKSANTPKAENTPVASVATETEVATTAPIETSTPTMTATKTLTPESTLGIGSTMINERDGAEMVYVPAGEFLMGYDESQRYNERPEHTVYLDSYWIYKFEVTNSQFYTFILSQGVNFNSSLLFNRVDNDNILFQENEEWLIDEDFVDYPIKGVTWNGAIEYCEWAGGEIPTEAEWEKAARGTDGRLYPWGNNFPTASLTNFEPYSTKPVGTYLEGISPYGALDMTGNVYEWVSDWYSADYYSISPDENPRGPEIGSSRILRGGYWVDKGWYGGFRVTYRIPSRPDNTYSFYGYGFRCIIPEE